MSDRRRRGARLLIAVTSIAGLVACGSPSAPTPATPTTPTAAGPTPTPLTQPPQPSDFTPSPTGCPPLADVTGPWPSDRLEAVDAVADAMQDLVRFRFAEPSVPGASSEVTVGVPTSELLPGEPDEPIEIDGGLSRVIRIRGLADPAAFAGERDLRPGLVKVQQVKVIEETADSMTWAVGAGYSCLSLRATPGDRTIAIAFTHAVP